MNPDAKVRADALEALLLRVLKVEPRTFSELRGFAASHLDRKKQGRDLDRALQRLRKREQIVFDSKRGWSLAPAPRKART